MREALLVALGLILGTFFGYYWGAHSAMMRTDSPEPALTQLLESMGSLVGTWTTADGATTREFKDTGEYREGGGNADLGNRFWMLFTKEVPDQQFTGELHSGVLYMALAQEGKAPEYFTVRLSDTELSLTPVSGGSTETLTRAP